MILDIDQIKRINDQHGHAAGDEVLKALAMVICNLLKNSDKFVRIIGGEEFDIMQPNTSPVCRIVD